MTAESIPPEPQAAATVTPVAGPEPTSGRYYTEMGYVFAAVGAILFSTKAVIIKLAYQDPIDAETLLALRMGLALPFYAIIGWLAVRDRRQRKVPLPSRNLAIKALLVGALGYWFASYTDFLGLTYISATFERLILFTYPLFVVLLGAAFFSQPIRLRAVAAIGISYIGLAMIFGEKVSVAGQGAAIGASLIFAAAISFALYQLLAKNLIGEIGPRLFTCIAMSGAALGAFIQFLLTHPLSDLVVTTRLYLLAFLIAVAATVLPSFFLNAALGRISAQANATIGTMSPVVTIMLAVAILGEHLTLLDFAGTALVLAGVGWFAFADQAGARKDAQASQKTPTASDKSVSGTPTRK